MLSEVFAKLKDKGIKLNVTDSFGKDLLKKVIILLMELDLKKSCNAFIRR